MRPRVFHILKLGIPLEGFKWACGGFVFAILLPVCGWNIVLPG
jgi:hypothetical protein